MGDVEDGQAELARLLFEEVEDARPDGDVEHRDGLIGDQELRLQHQGARDRKALALAAAELVRELVGEGPGWPQAGPLEGLGHALPALGGVAQALGAERFRHGGVDAEARID